MIVVKGQTVQSLPSDLTLKQKLEAFVKYHTTQVLAFFASIYGVWQLVPDDVKADLFSSFPAVAKYKSVIYIVGAGVAFYFARMQSQVVQVTPQPDVLTPAQVQPMVLVPAVQPVAPTGLIVP